MLLEVLLAMSVLSFAILVVFQSLRMSLQMARGGQERYAASLLLEERIGIWQKTGNTEDDFKESETLGPVSWRQEALPALDNTWHVERTRLSWGQGPQEKWSELDAPVIDDPN